MVLRRDKILITTSIIIASCSWIDLQAWLLHLATVFLVNNVEKKVRIIRWLRINDVQHTWFAVKGIYVHIANRVMWKLGSHWAQMINWSHMVRKGNVLHEIVSLANRRLMFIRILIVGVCVKRTAWIEVLVVLRNRGRATMVVSNFHHRRRIVLIEHYLQSHCVYAGICGLWSSFIATRHSRVRVFDMPWQLAATILVIVKQLHGLTSISLLEFLKDD